MLIFVVLIAITILSFVIAIKSCNELLVIIPGISLTVLIILAIIAILTNITYSGDMEANKKLYESLTYQLENNIYDSNNNIGKSELYEKITNWNTDLARGKAMTHNIWIGIFWSDVYDEFDFIEFPEGG